jgi:hypothetical protein
VREFVSINERLTGAVGWNLPRWVADGDDGSAGKAKRKVLEHVSHSGQDRKPWIEHENINTFEADEECRET